MTASKISGAEDPKAMRDKLAMVAFQSSTFLVLMTCPFASLISIVYVCEVTYSIPPIKISAIIDTPKNK